MICRKTRPRVSCDPSLTSTLTLSAFHTRLGVCCFQHDDSNNMVDIPTGMLRRFCFRLGALKHTSGIIEHRPNYIKLLSDCRHLIYLRKVLYGMGKRTAYSIT